MHKIGMSMVLAAALLGGCKKKNADTGAGSGSDTMAGSGSATMTGSGSATPAATGSGSGSGSAAAGSGSGSGSGSADGSGSAAAGSGSGSAAAGDRVTVTGFSTPESVLYDADADVYLVSNINGKPTDVDNNGFISKVSPDGKIAELKWIEGGKNKVTLDAPKGMAIVKGTLYVADITAVRMFDAKTGAPKGEVKIAGATFLNDMTPAGDDGVFVSDMGVDPSFKPTGTDAIYKIGADHKATPLIKNKDLGGPNGVVQVGTDVYVVTFASGEIYAVNAKGEKQAATKLPKGQLDGVIAREGGDFLVSSWEGKAVYAGKGAEWKEVATDLTAPADIGWDSKRKKLLVPQFQDNQILIIGGL